MNRPYYDENEDCWKVDINGRIEEGDLYWCVSEFIKDNLFYKLGDGDHTHSFDGVLHKIVVCESVDNIEGDRKQYSEQELRIIDKLKAKIGNMNNQILHYEDEEFISRRPKVKDFVQEYTSYLKDKVGKKNPYRDPDDYRKCREIYKMSKNIWGDCLPDVWVTDQLGFSAPSDRRTIYGKYLDESNDEDKYEFVAKCIYDTRTIGGCFIWPKVEREGLGKVSEYNKVRGGNKKRKIFLEDRPDVALLEIHHFYEKYKTYGTNVYSEFISQYTADKLNKNWMIFDYTSNYPSNNVEYEKMFIWLSKFEKFENYCKHFGFIGNFVVKDDEDLKIVDIVKSDLSNEEYAFISQPVDYSIYNLQMNDIRKMLDNVQYLVMKRSRKIHSMLYDDSGFIGQLS